MNRQREADMEITTPTKKFSNVEDFLKYATKTFSYNPAEDVWETGYGLTVIPVSSDVYINNADEEGNLNPEVLESLYSVQISCYSKQGKAMGTIYIDPEDCKYVGMSKYTAFVETKKGSTIWLEGWR